MISLEVFRIPEKSGNREKAVGLAERNIKW